MTNRKLGITLTHFNRFDLLVQSIAQVVEDERVKEVCIVDDCSTDTSYGDLLTFYQYHPKVHIFQNDKNLDCYRNKREAVYRSGMDWVVLLDSDNVIGTDYLDRLFSIERWDPRVAYLPDYAKPHFDYREFRGLRVDRSNVAKLMKKKHFATALNTANYFFFRSEYLRVWDGTIDPVTADSITQNYHWLKGGNSLQFVEGLEYFHRVHEGSHYQNNVQRTGNFAQMVEDMLKMMS